MRYRVIALSGFKSVQGETRFLLVRSEQSDEYCKLLYSTEYILLCAYKHPDEHLSISPSLHFSNSYFKTKAPLSTHVISRLRMK